MVGRRTSERSAARARFNIGVVGLALAVSATGLAACSADTGDSEPFGAGEVPGDGEGGAGLDQSLNPDNAPEDPTGGGPDGELPPPNPDAFWEDDPPPMYCGPDDAPMPEAPGGTPECPDDKNREGCPCTTPGETAPCWPGLRANRNRGICSDGMTTCEQVFEFASVWGACTGFVPPSQTATTGAGACRCFSEGAWRLENLSPCIFSDASGAVAAIVSTDLTAQCPSVGPGLPPMHSGDWSNNTLQVDCAGQFELCFTLKAGDVENPSDSDCVLAEICTSAWYPEPGEVMALPPLGGWTSTDTVCGQRFVDEGGYGEMSVLGESIECDPVDDGAGNRYVFNRTGYCPAECSDNPDLPECANCGQGGGGDF